MALYPDLLNVVISYRCLGSNCRGIHFDGGICKILYEMNDIPESERAGFNPVTITSSEEKLLVNGNDFFLKINLVVMMVDLREDVTVSFLDFR